MRRRGVKRRGKELLAGRDAGYGTGVRHFNSACGKCQVPYQHFSESLSKGQAL